MLDERQFISRVEAANADEFAQILRTVDAEQERALRAWLGDAAFTRMRNRALGLAPTRDAVPAKLGNVVVLHGILGGELSENTNKIWINILRLAIGEFRHLAMNAGGQSLNPVSATGILKKYYGDLLLELAGSWNVQYLPFDWRADIFDSADLLAAAISRWFPHQPVHIVAHSMGGLVARAAIQRHPDLWTSMAPGKLIMLGTPNYGALAIPLLFNGLNSTINTVATIDVAHSKGDLLQSSENFTGVWQMLPSLAKLAGMEPLYLSETYTQVSAPQSALERARAFQVAIADTVDTGRMIYVAGYNRRTASGISDFHRLGDLHSYTMTMRGDGTVPHSLGLIDGVQTFYVDEEHGNLPANRNVIQAMSSLLQTGTVAEPILWHNLDNSVPDVVRGPQQQELQDASLAKMAADQAEVQALMASLHIRGSAVMPSVIAPEESRLQDHLFHGLSLDSAPGTEGAGATASLSPPQTEPAAAPRHLRIRVVESQIETIATGDTAALSSPPDCGDELPIDAIAVGHYVGVKPVYAELALDQAISAALGTNDTTNPGSLILTGFTERGTMRGELGQPFLIPDPRDLGAGPQRLIAIAGMGTVGRFGVPEAAVLARELCWSLAKLGKRHLATVLIGSGTKNLTIEDAASGWLQGIQRAVAEASPDCTSHLNAITFVEQHAKRAEELKQALAIVSQRIATAGVVIELCDPPQATQSGEAKEPKDEHGPATRISAELRDGVFRFGALTQNASVPEREVSLNPALVFDVNDLIAGERDLSRLSARGDFLRRLLMPRDLEDLLSGGAPLVLACDSTVARIHWELMTQPRPQCVATITEGNFLGLCRGFTRQLRTTFAPAPEPPPPPRRRLRVLVIGDTAADMPLPAARAEALAVCELFQQINKWEKGDGNSAEVVSMIGPGEANWALVMEQLLECPPFDVLHYAGHCTYNEKDPESSGWIFSNGNILSARELARADQVPKFVFSNACESGITPSRSEMRTAALAPGFAEMFFGRGVANFVCTAWPVEDTAAQTFAMRLYRGLLGLTSDGRTTPEPMYKAMREARNAIMGGGSWGAYQHYGNPYFRFFR